MWLGFGAGANQHFMLDVGVPVVHSGAASWGIHVGFVGLNGAQDGSPAVGSSKETQFDCFQAGGWSDWGRGYAAFGAEHLQRSVTYMHTNGSVISNTDQLGAYVKAGYRISEHWSVYISVGSHSKLLGGIGLNF
jgi:hypothetical protein